MILKKQKFINIRSVFSVLAAIFVMVGIICLNFWFSKKQANAPTPEITSFEECVLAGNPVTESYPLRCRTSDGKTFIEEIKKNAVEEFTMLIGEKYQQPVSEVYVDLAYDNGTHFRGKYWLGPGKEGEGENFFAVKNGDEYEIVFDGSSGFTCQMLDKSGFPKEMREGCYEEWVGTGTIRGNVNIGPICPVEREGVPRAVPREAYTSRTLIVYRADDKKEIFSSPIKPDGTYDFVLTSGKYIIDMKSLGLDSSSDLPHEFMLVDGQSLKFDISIDTGIR